MYGKPASIAISTTAMTSPASAPIMVKPRMRSSLSATRAFIKPSLLAGRLRPQHGARRQSGDPRDDALTLRFAFAQSDVRERRIGKHAVRDQPIARASPPSGQIVANDAKVVFGYVGEQRAAGAFAERPDVRRARLQPLVDANVTATVQLDADLAEADPGGVRNAPRRDEDVAALDFLLARVRADVKAHSLSGLAAHLEELGRDKNLDAFVSRESAASHWRRRNPPFP